MLLFIENIADDVQLGLWKIEEEPSLKVRERERKAVRELVAAMLIYDDPVDGQTEAGSVIEIGHEESGKPLLEGWHISISHTKGYAAVLLSKIHEVGIDIEYVNERVRRIASHFLRPDEHAESVSNLLIHWCAKETIYKLYSNQNLTYQQMKVAGLSSDNNSFTVESESFAGVVSHTEVYYRINDDYVLTFAYYKEI